MTEDEMNTEKMRRRRRVVDRDLEKFRAKHTRPMLWYGIPDTDLNEEEVRVLLRHVASELSGCLNREAGILYPVD